MATIEGLIARGKAARAVAVGVDVDQGVICGLRLAEAPYAIGRRGVTRVALHEWQAEVVVVRTYLGFEVARESIPAIRAACKAALNARARYEVGYAGNCGVTEGLRSLLADCQEAGVCPDLADVEDWWWKDVPGFLAPSAVAHRQATLEVFLAPTPD